MDIKSQAKQVEQREDAGFTVHIRDELGEKLYQDDEQTKPVTITVVGTYSRTYRRTIEAQRDRNIKQRKFNLDGDELLQQALELEAACIRDWDGFTDDGAPVPYTKANAVALLRQYPWIREQVNAAMNDHAAFFQQPSPSSVSA